ncbi:MAG: hypothetical protein A2Y63_06170 [Candidatus Riflebacteria bacterium RBG_13_59_9]|nr:MAG: hypothetical protein A2Y63_06170 [Candidatus Riflebacteria bacterium RBG_13_59_9]
MIASIVVWIVSAVFGWLTCGWLFNWVYTSPPNIWRTPQEMSTNLVWVNLLGLLVAVIFVLVFAWLYRGLPGTGVRKGLAYGFIVWLVGALCGIITMPFYMTIATTVVIYWIIQALVLDLIKGAIAGAIYRQKGGS